MRFPAATGAGTSSSARRTRFVVGSVEVANRDHLTITIFDAHNSAHSIEILNPAAMRIYDDVTGKGFAVSFLSEAPGDVETRCYLRDEGEDGVEIQRRERAGPHHAAPVVRIHRGDPPLRPGDAGVSSRLRFA